MFTHTRTIFLRETDATGVLFFSEQLNLALEAMESYFLSRGFSLTELIEDQDFLLPIVHAETDFFAPIKVGDQISLLLSCEKMGTSSFTMRAEVFNQQEVKVGTTKIVHVAVSKQSGASMKLPELIVEHLHQLED